MKKISRKDLQGLRRQFPVLTKEEMRQYVGGYGNGYSGGDGFNNDWLYHGFGGYDPDGNFHWYRGYTQEELDNWEGPWPGGWVYGLGYVAPDTVIYGGNGWNDYDPWGYNYNTDWGNTGYPWNNGYPGNYGYPGYYGYDIYGNNENNWFPPEDKYKEIWETNKFLYFQMAASLGIILSGVEIEIGKDRSAKAWIEGNKIMLGSQFFNNLNDYDRVAVLIHEMMHLQYDNISIPISQTPTKGILADVNSVPSYVKEYIDLAIQKSGGVSSLGYDSDFKDYVDYYNLSSSVYYENELQAYKKEVETCPDSYVSKEYALERKYNIWKYEQLLQRAKELNL